MASWRNFLYPVRQSLSVITSSFSSTSASRQLFYSKLDPLKGLEPLLRIRASRFQWKLNAQPKCSQSFCFSEMSSHLHLLDSGELCFLDGRDALHSLGSKLRVGSILGVSAVCGAIRFWLRVAYAMDGHDILVHDDAESSGASDVEEDLYALWKFVRKLWVPVLFFISLLAHLNDPITLIAFKVILFLLTTKPSPFSVYVFVDELCHQSMRQEPHLYHLKSLYAHKVEVQDYKLLCLATVEVRDQRFTLIGVLGGWWAWPLLQSHGVLSLLKVRIIDTLKNTNI